VSRHSKFPGAIAGPVGTDFAERDHVLHLCYARPMSATGILIGVLNCFVLAIVLVLIGAVIVWLASVFEWPIPWNIQRLYLGLVLLLTVICIVSLLVGAPMVHIFGR
jgi:hypothetical protein